MASTSDQAAPKIVRTAFSNQSVLKLDAEEVLNLFYADKSAWRFETDDGRVLFVVTRNRDLGSRGYDDREEEARQLARARFAKGANGDVVDLDPLP
jgi:hypothetical protein